MSNSCDDNNYTTGTKEIVVPLRYRIDGCDVTVLNSHSYLDDPVVT